MTQNLGVWQLVFVRLPAEVACHGFTAAALLPCLAVLAAHVCMHAPGQVSLGGVCGLFHTLVVVLCMAVCARQQCLVSWASAAWCACWQVSVCVKTCPGGAQLAEVSVM